MSVYQCKFCDFYSTNHSDYNKHITTTKHLSRAKNAIDENSDVLRNIEIETKNKESKLFLCNRCNKAYKSKNGLMHHTKKCICGAIMDVSNEIIPIDISFLEQERDDVHNHVVGRIPYAEEYDYEISSDRDDISVGVCSTQPCETSVDSVVVTSNVLTENKDEDEFFHMGIILDLLPEAHVEMVEYILFAASIGIISTTLFFGLQFFY